MFLKLYPSWQSYLEATPGARRWLFTARAGTDMWSARFEPGDHLVFGAEPTGLPREILEGGAGSTCTIPMLEDRRSLNLSTAVGIAAYEALRQVRG